MRVIFKYPIPIAEESVIDLPVVCKPLTVQEQRGKLQLWCEVDDACVETMKTNLYIVGTGGPIPDMALYYLGTAQIGSLVWHLYTNNALLDHRRRNG